MSHILALPMDETNSDAQAMISNMKKRELVMEIKAFKKELMKGYKKLDKIAKRCDLDEETMEDKMDKLNRPMKLRKMKKRKLVKILGGMLEDADDMVKAKKKLKRRCEASRRRFYTPVGSAGRRLRRF